MGDGMNIYTVPEVQASYSGANQQDERVLGAIAAAVLGSVAGSVASTVVSKILD